MKFISFALLICLCLPLCADAEADQEFGWETGWSHKMAWVAAPVYETSGPVFPEKAGFHLDSSFKASHILDNGLKLGAHLTLGLQLDHPGRKGFAGTLGEVPAMHPADRRVLLSAQRGAFTGLAPLGHLEEDRLQARLQAGFIYVDGGYGEVLAGLDSGIARRFYEGPPNIFKYARLSNARLDTSGIAALLTRNDLSGPSFKVSYATPRLLGVRFGASYSPRANRSSLDRTPNLDIAGIAEPHMSDIAEFAVNISRRHRASGIRFEAYGAFARARLRLLPDKIENGTVEVWSGGVRVNWKGLDFGMDALTSDNGAGRYTAWSMGGHVELSSNWQASLNYGQARDDALTARSETWSAGVARALARRVTLALGVQSQKTDFEYRQPLSYLAPVVEISLSF